MTTQDVPDELPLPVIRFAISAEGEGLSPVRLTLTEQLDGSVKFAASGDEEFTPKIAKLASEVSAKLTQTESSIDGRLNLIADAIRSRIEAEGYLVRNLPTSDVRITAAFDLRTGQLVGRHEALHNLIPLDGNLAERINLSLSEAFKKAPIELAAEIDRLIDLGDHLKASAAVVEGRSGLGFFGKPPIGLLDALKRIDVTTLKPDTEKEVREIRMAVAAALKKFDDAEVDAQEILDRFIENPIDGAKYTNVVAFSCFQRGETETAITMWRDLLKSSHLISSDDRAWAWRNLANALPTPGAEAIRAARMSIDAFLEAGDKREAATSIMLLSKLLEFEGAASAIEQLNKMLDIIDANGIIEDTLRSSIYHSLATQLLNLRSFTSALEAALESVKLLEGIVGAKKHLIPALHLASILAEKCLDKKLSEELSSRAISLEEGDTAKKYVLARRIHLLFTEFDARVAKDILSEANQSGNSDLIAACEVAIATSDPSLDTAKRIRKLESLVIRLSREKASPEAKYPAMSAIVTILRQDGKLDRAQIWLRKILSEQPLNLNARDELLQLLWHCEAWGDAAIFTKEQIDLHGELPGLLFAHGKSLLEAGDISGALLTCMQALNKTKKDNPIRETIFELREKALSLGGTIPTHSTTADITKPIIREELLEALNEFANFISADKRMGFWYRPQPKEDYRWVSHPEKRAQDLFHTFLKARFLHRISIYEELDTGAGRLDIYLKLDGGLSVIIELKMCGFGYSSTYAASGEVQIQHYMANRSSHLGYLLVFDARLKQNGSPLIDSLVDSSKTIHEVFVDVRPRVTNVEKKKHT
ncbi:tetratricopeptide repeat protein [Pseudomonas lurida]|uniref:tetratricopeptide repeat protein n=1 Tax=Pseudomonas lurida TaxID=244566 RepID=UPI0027323B25|nr:hypothetical protein [Pseudomonas lurida]WLG28771.1 hypothetical protein PSH68_00895 [Pseudomonas lurida]